MLEGLRSLADHVDAQIGPGGVGTRLREGLRTRRANVAFRRRSHPDGEPAPDAPRHVVVLVVDALRADAVTESVTPHLASLPGTAAVSPSTWTFPSVTSLLSGRYPHGHGATRQVDDFANSVADVTGLPPRADFDVDLLPDRLAGAGYRTRGAFAMIVPFLALSGRFGSHALYRDAPAERVLADHLRWLTDRREERTFSYVHLGDLHEPVDPPADFWAAHDVDPSIPGIRGWRFEAATGSSPTVDRYRAHRKRLYRAAAEYVDTRIARFHARLGDLMPESTLVVAGDHGEGFWERAAFHADRFADPRPAYCVGHGGAPYEPIARVPLCVSGAGVADRAPLSDGVDVAASDRDGDRRSLIDVAPTVLDAVGLAVPPAIDGTALASPAAGRRLLVESARYGYEKRAVYDGDRKVIASRGDDVVASFSLPDGTSRPLSADRRDELLATLPPWPAERSGRGTRDADSGGGRTVSQDVERRLERLGYR